MATFKQIKASSLLRTKLNNAEYTDFIIRVQTVIGETGADALKIPADTLAAFEANAKKMTDIVNRTSTSEHTASLAKLDEQRDAIVVYFFTTLRSSLKSPFEAQRTAAEKLYALTKSYTGIQSLPNRQETAKIEALLTDLDKEGMAANVAAVGLTETVGELTRLNAEYRTTTDARSREQAADTLEAGKTIRKETNALYDEMMTYAQAAAVLSATEATDKFVDNLNKIIDETAASYKMRTAKRNGATADPDAPDTENGGDKPTDENEQL